MLEKDLKVEEFVDIYIEFYIQLFGLLDTIVSDINSIFNFDF
jgi:hypothetical protein